MDKRSNTATEKREQAKTDAKKKTKTDKEKQVKTKSQPQEERREGKGITSHTKRRLVVSYKNLSPDLLSEFKDKYPKGYADYMSQIFKVDKPDGTFFYAVSLDLADAIYLVKIDVKIDDYEDAEADIFGSEGDNDVSTDDSDEFPDDDTSGFVDEEESDT